MPRLQPRKYPAIMRSMMLLHEPTHLQEAREKANKYVRASLQAAFDTGWYAHARNVPVSFSDENTLLSPLGKCAWREGWHAREAYDTAHIGKDEK